MGRNCQHVKQEGYRVESMTDFWMAMCNICNALGAVLTLLGALVERKWVIVLGSVLCVAAFFFSMLLLFLCP